MKLDSYSIHDFVHLQEKIDAYLVFGYGTKTVRVRFSSRRFMDIRVNPDIPVSLVYYDEIMHKVCVIDLENNDGTYLLDKALKDNSIWSAPLELKDWQFLKKYRCSSDFYLYSNGFYLFQNLWLDCNVYYTFLASNGIDMGKATLCEMVYESVDFEPEQEYHDFLAKMLSDGCTQEEYDTFKALNIRKAGINAYNKYRENWI